MIGNKISSFSRRREPRKIKGMDPRRILSRITTRGKDDVKNQLGFTIMEMLVALAIFAVTIVAATQIFQMAIRSQRNAVATQNVEEAMRYALEFMSKEIRNAVVDNLITTCGNLGDGVMYYQNAGFLYLKNKSSHCVDYRMNNDQLFRHDAATGDDLPLTPDEIEINSLAFVVTDYDDATQQGKVTIKMKVRSKIGMNNPITLQTTVSARKYD